MTRDPGIEAGTMQPLVETRRQELAALCRRFRVRRLDLFGSAAGADFAPERSDVDFLVELEPAAESSRFNGYFDLKEALESLFRRPVDLVMAGAVDNPYVKSSIERSRQTVYAAAGSR